MNDAPLEDRVHDGLHRRVDTLQRAPLTVTDVRTRARRIQRGRRAVAGAAVAAVLAVAVPLGLAATGPTQRSDVPPATDPPAPAVAGTVRIDPRSAPVGGASAVPLINVDDPSLVVDGEKTPLPRDYHQLTPYLDGWAGLTVSDEPAGWIQTLQVLDADFGVLDEATSASVLAVSSDASRLAWAEYDGGRWVLVDRAADGARDERRTPLPLGPEQADVRPVGFLPGEAMVVSRTDPATGDESALVVSPDGATTPVPGFIHPGSADPVGGLVSGQTSFSGDGSCWQVRDAVTEGAPVVWRTCDYSVLAFSPDGRHVLGFTDYLTPDGSPTLAILDAASGERVVDFELAGARTGVVGINPEVAWEDDDTLVAAVVTGGRQYAVRLGLDGTVERVGGAGVEVRPGAVALKVAAAAG
ncbi:hypothetical protein HN031_11670 [Nocardioides sp. zg-1308]|uniref:hypothetical protein n=1 Tax=Nocardioides sp. zg-1308 TaxID=2736253 RepID=UPI0015530935|nr:hypothetical protein [Nocardioides sp. zg-1308]NPD05341.1 hypothetical protein [Nocardioides sp. zg-1308]